MIYTWLLILKETKQVLNNHISINQPFCGEPDKLEWIEWNNTLPDCDEMYLKDGFLVDKDGNLLELPPEEAENETTA